MNPRSIDKKQAQELIKETFESPFDKVRFTNFIKDLLNRIDESKAFHAHGYVKEGFRGVIKTYERIGTYNSADDKKIDVIIVYLQKGFSLDHARVTQRNFAGRYLADRDNKHAGLFAFVSPEESDWRFSLVTIDYEIVQSKAGNWKGREKFSQARRWSFLVGENEKSHTAQSRLVNILANDEQDSTLKEIQKAFDIETVTKEFFFKYRELFLNTKEELDRVVKKDPKIKADFEAKGVDTVNFAKKLLGQIIFLYFLQKKGWFGVGRNNDWGTGSKHFLRELFQKKHGDYNNFFNDILEPLFYEALRTGEDRKHEDYYYSRFNCKIPFLNGGLFDPIGNYDWVRTDILISDKLFSNNVKTKESYIGTGILDVFDRYNFTVKEDEPLEKEVAIDPELLGKSYEKFNAIRPDNFGEFKKALKSGKKGEENKFNKKFGVYYTPREIVHYMCQQSLINYLSACLAQADLATELSDSHSSSTSRRSGESRNPVPSKEDIETLIHTGEQFSENEARVLSKGKETKTYSHQLPESIRRNAKQIDYKLAEITVCDPAVGSGAFPVGMMSEIVKARNVLSVFIDDKKRKIYNFKRQCIEHSLYGVDIDPGAVEIAKLRLWLSLVVDEEDIKNIKPLPNLDYKIMLGNSLIELLSTESLVSSIDNRRTELVKELKISKDELFNIAIPTQKENKRREIDILMKKLFEYDRDKQIKRLKDHILAVKSQQRLFEDDKDKKEDEKKIRKIKSKIKEIKNIDVPGPTEHFEWHINYSEIFQAKGGFDVVIANPPYVNIERLDDKLKQYIFLHYQTCSGRTDIYTAFIENSLAIIKDSGLLTFIIPYAFTNQKYGTKLRKHLIDNYFISEILDTSDYFVFETANVKNIVLRVQKTKNVRNTTIKRAESADDFQRCSLSTFFLDQQQFLDLKDYRFETKYLPEASSMREKILSNTLPFEEICFVAYGARLNHKTKKMGKDHYISESYKATFKPYLEGKNIERYHFAQYGWLSYHPKEHYNPMFAELFENPKLVTINVVKDELRFAFDNKSFYNSHTVINCVKWHFLANAKHISVKRGITKKRITNSSNYDYKYLLAILNSKLMSWYFMCFLSEKLHFYPNDVKSMPIKTISTKDQNPFTKLVDLILAITKSEDYLENPKKQAEVKSLEAEIDQLVYKLYDFTPEEIKIVEGENK